MQKAKTILIVGDDPGVSQALGLIPSSYELRIESVENSFEILPQIAVGGYDLILTDTQTPATFDVELLKRIGEVRPDAKVIVLAADSSPEGIMNSIREHAFSYFSVPFEAQMLADMICKALDIPVWEDSIEVLSARSHWIALEVRCKMLAADRLMQFMGEIKIDMPEPDRENIAIAFRELLLNAMEHGGGFDEQKKIFMEYMRTSRVLLYHLRDPGPGFSFDALPHAAVSNPPEAPAEHIFYREEHGLRPGGFGILIIKNLVDELFYNEKGNEVLLVKYLKDPPADG